MKEDYFEMATSLSRDGPTNNAQSKLLFTYTAMHGVGLPFASRMFDSFGFPKANFSVVEEQAQPDPSFPTVKFPNPEEKGALVGFKTPSTESFELTTSD